MSEKSMQSSDGLDATQAEQLVVEIQRLIGSGAQHLAEAQADFEDAKQLIELAHRERAWVPLGFESWRDLCDEKFSPARIWTSSKERQARVQALMEAGLSSRAIGDVLGVSYKTAQRDIAAGTNVPAATAPAAPAAPSDVPAAQPKVLGLDGKERPRKRATPAEMADRALLVAQRRAEGWTQEEIAESIGVTQRTVSNDDHLVQAWKAELSAAEAKRLEKGQLSRAELAERANLEIVERDRKRLEAGARNGARALADGLKFLSESVVYADAWLEERTETSAILAPSLANVAGEGTEWMALEFDYNNVPDEALQVLHDDLGRAAEWAHQAQLRLISAAEARGAELDRDGYRDGLARKVEARRGRQR